MGVDECENCATISCAGDCVAWVDGGAHSMSELVALWGIQARQVKEHLAHGTHPRCVDGSIVRRVSDGQRLRPCTRRGGMSISIEARGLRWQELGLSSAAKALGVPRSTLYKILRDPGRPIPADWDCEALRSDLGWHYRAPGNRRA